MAAALTVSTEPMKYTAKSDAERLAAKLSSLMLKADRTHSQFQLNIVNNKLVITWRRKNSSVEEKFEPNPGCSFSWNVDVLYYSYITNKYSQGATITVTGKGDPYYVIIAVIGSRVRVSNVEPES